MTKVKDDVKEKFEKMGLNLGAIEEGRKYQVRGVKIEDKIMFIEAENLKKECLRDYVSFCATKIDQSNPKELKKIEFAMKVAEKDPNFNVEDYLGSLYKNSRQFIILKLKEQGIEAAEAAQKAPAIVEEALLQELNTLMQAKGTLKEAADYKLVMAKYSPQQYSAQAILGKGNGPIQSNKSVKELFDEIKTNLWNLLHLDVAEHPCRCIVVLPFVVADGLLLGGLGLPLLKDYLVNRKSKKRLGEQSQQTPEILYELELTKSERKINKAAKATVVGDAGSCIAGGSGTIERIASDPGCFFFTAKIGGKLLGYARAYLLESEKGEPLLALDTIEVPRKDFEAYTDLVNAISQGVIQFGLDINAAAIIAKDARASYGSRQAFGNTKRKFRLMRACNGNGYMYTFCSNVGNVQEAFLLMQNWRR